MGYGVRLPTQEFKFNSMITAAQLLTYHLIKILLKHTVMIQMATLTI